MRRVRLDSEATVQRLDSITNKNATIDYNITRYTTHNIMFSPMTYVNIPSLVSGTIPRRIAIGFQRNEGVSDNENVAIDSLYFENIDIERIVVKNDNKIYPKEGGYQLNQSATGDRQKKIGLHKVY